MAWTSAMIGDKHADVFAPPTPRFGLLWLPDPTDEHPNEKWFAPHSIACVVPHGGKSWWTDRIWPAFDATRSAEKHIIEFVHPWMQQQLNLNANHIAIAGVGGGGQGASRIAFKHPALFPVVAAIEPAVDQQEAYGQGAALDEMYASREHCRQDSAILHIHPAKQPAHIWFASAPGSFWHRGNDRLHEKLAALGVAHQFTSDDTMKAMMAFLVNALERQSRRLL